MEIVNLTPHPITVEFRTFPPSGDIARVSVELTTSAHIDCTCPEPGRCDYCGGHYTCIPLVLGAYGEVTGLPEPSGDTFYIVSTMVRLAVHDRTDVGSPADMVRDDQGRIVGCRALEINPEASQ